MQTIARVNRVFAGKEGGLIVDYVGIISALKQAMKDYTVRDKENYGDMDISHSAYPKFLEKLSICKDLFYGYDYSKFVNGTNLERSKAVSGAVNFILDVSKEKELKNFVKEALLLHQALSLCSSIVERDLRVEAAFFESVRVILSRISDSGASRKISLQEMNSRINNLLKNSIKSEGVINLFSDIKEGFSIFDPEFMSEVSKMKEKNIAVKILESLILEQVRIYRKTNVVKSEKFSEIMQSIMNKYINGMITNEKVIEELCDMAKQIMHEKNIGKELGLTDEELAFYDALTKPQAIKDFYENDQLVAITKELTETLRKNRTIDWQKKETVRARMRRCVRHLLKRYKYPPSDLEYALETVIKQCEQWADRTDL